MLSFFCWQYSHNYTNRPLCIAVDCRWNRTETRWWNIYVLWRLTRIPNTYGPEQKRRWLNIFLFRSLCFDLLLLISGAVFHRLDRKINAHRLQWKHTLFCSKHNTILRARVGKKEKWHEWNFFSFWLRALNSCWNFWRTTGIHCILFFLFFNFSKQKQHTGQKSFIIFHKTNSLKQSLVLYVHNVNIAVSMKAAIYPWQQLLPDESCYFLHKFTIIQEPFTFLKNTLPQI